MSRFFRGFVAQWRLLTADKAAALLVFGGFVIYSLVFPAPYAAEIARHNPIAVVDLDRSSLSRQLIQTAQASGAVEVVDELRAPEEAYARLQAGSIRGFLIIPENFRRDVVAGRAPTIAWGGDAVYLTVYSQMATAFAGALGNLNGGIRLKKTLATGVGVPAAKASLAPVSYVGRPVFNTREGIAAYSAPAVMILVMQQTILLAVGVVMGTARERELFGRLAGEGLGQFLGRAAVFVIIYWIQAIYFYGFVHWFWEFPRYGALGPALLFLLPFILASTFFAVVIGSWFRRREAALFAIGVVGMPMAYLAGFAWPHEALPEPLRILAWILPSTAGIQGSLQLMQMGASFGDVLPRWALLWLLAIIYGYPAWRILSKAAGGERAS